MARAASAPRTRTSRSSTAKPKAKKAATVTSHPRYEDMIRDAIIALKERKGSSRQRIKKYILTTFKLPDNSTTSSRLRLAINKGVEKGTFQFLNGPSGTIKLVKKDAVKKDKKEPEKKEVKPKKAAEKKEVKPKVEKKTTTKKAPARKAAASTTRKSTAAATAKSKKSSGGVTKKSKPAATTKKPAVGVKRSTRKRGGTTST
ncbi:5285_t:CDS:2 [Diversispora eburnea]|uniref:Histone H1 n=1 Tax=Diversispora eburnea TaxID=1213867 RepID=A0A9N8UWG1_9GLOM|nr:5285_t:CDS:2 [Diversispora eburnea]